MEKTFGSSEACGGVQGEMGDWEIGTDSFPLMNHRALLGQTPTMVMMAGMNHSNTHADRRKKIPRTVYVTEKVCPGGTA